MRHGEIASNGSRVYSGRSPEPLTGCGVTQAHDAGRGLVGTGIQGIVSSPLVRATQTAAILAEILQSPVTTSDSFTELAMGPWEGLSEERVAKDFPQEWALWNKSPADLMLPGRETLAAVQVRILDGLRWARSAYPGSAPLLLVSHVAILRVLILTAEGSPLNNYKKLEIPNAVPIRLQIK